MSPKPVLAALLATALLAGIPALAAADPGWQLARRGADDAQEKESETHKSGDHPATTPAASQAPAADPKAKALFESKCSACHSLDRPLGRTKDREGWTRTVMRMKNVNGCPLTDSEAGAIIEYLTQIRGPAAGK